MFEKTFLENIKDNEESASNKKNNSNVNSTILQSAILK